MINQIWPLKGKSGGGKKKQKTIKVSLDPRNQVELESEPLKSLCNTKKHHQNLLAKLPLGRSLKNE